MERIEPPEPGIYDGVPIEEYLAWDLPSQSTLKAMLVSGLHYQAAIHSDLDTEAFKVGRLVDCLVFEPDQFAARFLIRPATYENAKGERKPWNMNAQVCKDMVAQMEDDGRTVISQQTHADAAELAEAIQAHPAAKAILDAGGIAQRSYVCKCPDTGVVYKNRPDWIGKEAVVDLKTARDGSHRGFARAIGQYQYHMQMAVQTDTHAALTGEELEPLLLVAEKGVNAVAVYRLGIDSIEAGRQLFHRALRAYRTAKASGIWSGYSDFIEAIDAPHWALDGALEVSEVW